jgi:hypothetical protein
MWETKFHTHTEPQAKDTSHTPWIIYNRVIQCKFIFLNPALTKSFSLADGSLEATSNQTVY